MNGESGLRAGVERVILGVFQGDVEVAAEIADEEALDCALEWLRESYWLKCPPQLRAAVEGE